MLCVIDSCADEIHVPGSFFLLAVASLSVKSLPDLCFPALGICRIPVLPSVGFQTSSSCSTALLMLILIILFI